MKNRISAGKIRRALTGRIHWIVMGILVVWALFPILWAISSSLKTRFEVYSRPPTLLPLAAHFQNYVDVLQSQNFGRYFFNSSILALSSTVLALVISVLAGYAFARYKFRFATIAFFAIIIPRIVPRSSLIIPLYRIAAASGMLNNYVGLIISYTAITVPLSVWILTSYFKSIPPAMEESALLDGATRLQMIWHIVVPLGVPALVTVTVFGLRQAWNELPFVLALTTRSTMRTLQYELLVLQDSIGVINWPVILAFTMITIFPLVVAYLVFQRQVVSSLVSGAVK